MLRIGVAPGPFRRRRGRGLRSARSHPLLRPRRPPLPRGSAAGRGERRAGDRRRDGGAHAL